MFYLGLSFVKTCKRLKNKAWKQWMRETNVLVFSPCGVNFGSPPKGGPHLAIYHHHYVLDTARALRCDAGDCDGDAADKWRPGADGGTECGGALFRDKRK